MSEINFELLNDYNTLCKRNKLPSHIKSVITNNINSKFIIRDYQKEAFVRFEEYFEHDNKKRQPTHLLFQMATGSGKTLVMAGLIIDLYEQGYRNFLFFVNSTNVLEKTRDNFLNSNSIKYLFNSQIKINNQTIAIKEVNNFDGLNNQDINICFTTIQGLHSRLNLPSESSLTYEDFVDKKLVVLSDEAHHINVATKNKSAQLFDEENNWENTVIKVLNSNRQNVMLEFTATADLSNADIAKKYQDKLIYDYSLKQFYKDGYSKDVKTFQSGLSTLDRSLLAIILSQYRLHIFADNQIDIKPVIMFKANQANRTSKTDDSKVVISSEFKGLLLSEVAQLDGYKLLKIKNNVAQDKVLATAFEYFFKKDPSLENLALQLKEAFNEDKTIIIDSSASIDKRETQLLLNSLESHNNPIRAVFAVDALNEGWDVLNLFDIVRLYNTRDAKGTKLGKTTIAEAQLIGRGARYCPYKLNEQSPLDKRKFDEDIDNQLRICEQLYYHSEQNSRYIQELNLALESIGIPTDGGTKVERVLKLKDSFIQHDFYKHNYLFTNEQRKLDIGERDGIDENIRKSNIEVFISSSITSQSSLLDKKSLESVESNYSIVTRSISFGEIPMQITLKAIAKNTFYRLMFLKAYFPKLNSIREFITSDNYLNSMKINIKSYQTFEVEGLSIESLLNIACDFLLQLQDKLKVENERKIGTKKFIPNAINRIFKETTRLTFSVSDGDAELGYPMSAPKNNEYFIDLSSKNCDWHAYNENYGTSEEKSFVMFMNNSINKLRKKYQQIWLLRNERFFKLYNFSDGAPFEPDFVLFLVNKEGKNQVVYQVFIEPKGNHLISHDKWKQDFLIELKDNCIVETINETRDYKLIGLPFYNKDNNLTFESDFEKLAY
jgi:type III restriction enzyme